MRPHTSVASTTDTENIPTIKASGFREVSMGLPTRELLLDRLAHLRERFAGDDFGTGFSNLAYLHRLPLDALKIGRSGYLFSRPVPAIAIEQLLAAGKRW